MPTTQEMERSIKSCMMDHHVPDEVREQTIISHLMSKDYPLSVSVRSDTVTPWYRHSINVVCQYQFGVLMTSVQYIRIDVDGRCDRTDHEFDAVKIGWCRHENMLRHIGYFISTRLTKEVK